MADRPTDPASHPAPAPRRRWAWWKRLLAAFGVLVLLLIIFYQPIIFAVVKIVAPRLAARQNLRIDSLELGGTILTSLRVENLLVTPTAPGPIARANVGRLELHYSLPTLIRHGLNSAFIENVTLRDADVIYDPSKSPPSPPKKKEPFSLPPLPLPGQLSLRNVNFELLPASRERAFAAGQAAAASSAVPAPASPAVAATATATVGNGLLIRALTLELDPEHSGELKIGELRLPGGPDLHDVSATTSYHNRDLQLAGLNLAPEIRVRLLDIDGSKLEQQLLSIALDADLFGGRANLTANLQNIGTPPKASVKLDVNGLSFASVGDFFHVGTPPDNTLGGTLDNLTLRFDGVSDQPKSWAGRLETRVTRPGFGTAALDAINFRFTFRDGAAELEQADIVQGDNRMALHAHIDLAGKMENLTDSTGRGTLEINAPDFGKLPVKLPLEIAGSLHAGGDFTLAGGTFSTGLKGHVEALAVPAQHVSVAGVDFALDSSKVIPKGATAAPTTPDAPPPPHEPFYAGLKTRVAANVNGIRYADYAIDGVKLALTSNEAAVKLEQVEATRGPNVIDVDGTYRIPDDFANAQKSPLDVRLSVAIPDLTQFAVDPKNPVLPLQGKLDAKGNVTLVNGAYGGGFDLEARDLKAQGATVQTADVQIGIENNVATIKTGHIVLDDKNTVDLDGHGNLQAPYPFDAGLNLNLPDLARFNPVLAANGVNQTLAGSVNVTGKVGGHLATTPGANDQKIDGSLNIAAHDLAAHGAKIDRVDTQVVIENNRAVIRTGQIKVDGKNGITFDGDADVAAPFNYHGSFDVNLADLGTFAPLLEANGVKEKVGGTIRFTGETHGHLATAPDANDQQIDGTFDLSGQNIEAKGAKIASISGQIVAANKQATIKTLTVKVDDKNTLDINGQAATVAPFDYQASVNLNLLDLSAFQPLLRAAAMAGTSPQNATAAKIEAAQSATTPKLHEVNGPRSRAASDKPTTLVTKTATSKGPVAVAVKGAPRSPGRAEFVEPTPGTPPETKLGGSLQVQWQAQGNFAKAPDGPRFSGGGKVNAHKVEFNAVGPLEAQIEGKYSQQVIDFPVFYVASNGLEFRTVIGLKDALARVDKISLKQGPIELLAGYIQIPLDLNQLSAPGGPVPDVDKIDVNIASKVLSLETLLASVDKNKKAAPPAQGTVQLQIDAHGSLSKITADVKVAARSLRSPQTLTLRPADADVNLTLKDDRLDLNTVVRQGQIAPLTIKGNIPLDLHAIAASKQFDPKSPVDLTIQLPRSSLNFLGGVTKAIRHIEGDVAANVKVGGTIEKPVFTGDTELNIVAARADNITVPAVRDFHARLVFANNDLRIDRFAGEVGGGKIGASGHIGFAKLTEPTLDLAATAKDVLAVRDDNITARVNADVKVTGPFKAASVTGYVGITKSRYLKDIDIVPLNLPGKPAPAPPAPSSGSGEPESVGVNVAPINAWKLDLAIRTDDPFVIRGNLARGQALVDLHVKGTGGQPLLDGNVEIKDLIATLPFSTLEIADGNVAFTPDQPLNPVVDLTGTSSIRNYIITVYVTGRAKDPKVTFSSDPPQTQEQIVSLLATGSTPDELTGNSQALAGKATLLVLQDLYRRAFPKKRPRARNRRARSPTRSASTWAIPIQIRVSNRLARRTSSTTTTNSWPTSAWKAICGDACCISSASVDMGKRRIQRRERQVVAGVRRGTVVIAFAFLLSSCALFHPHHQEGGATVTSAGDVNIQFVGVTAFTARDLNDDLFDALDEIKAEGLRDATADDAAFFLELDYRKNGYAYVSTSYTIADPKHLILKVNEGPLVQLGDIRFTGNDHYPDTTNFQQYIIGQTRERFPAKQKVLPYVETDVQKGTDLVQRFYAAEGYLEAQVGTPTVEFVDNRTRANITVPIVEGRRYRFGDVSIDGDLKFPPGDVRGLIADQIPLPYTRPRVDDMQRKLQAYYKKKGYYAAEVTSVSDPVQADADGRVQTVFTVKPGPLYRFDGVRVVGTDRLKPEFLQNRFREISGQTYSPKALDDLYQKMIRTGLFAQLKVEAVPQPDNTLRLDIDVKEAKARQLGFGIGYDTFEGPLFSVELRDRDFNGTGRPISFTVDYSTRTLSGLLLYQDPYLFETNLEFEARLMVVQRKLDGYTKNEVGDQLQLTEPITKKLKVSVFQQLSKDNLSDVTIQEFNAGREKYTASSLGTTISLDLRDNPVTPTRGLVTAATLDVAADAFGSSIEFVRGTYRISYLKPIGKKSLLAAGFRLGIIKPFGETGARLYAQDDDDPKTPGVAKGFELPIDERFFLGGSTSVRSFVERELGPYDSRNGNPIGGEAYTVFNLEYQFPLKLADLKGAVFFDAGNLRQRAEQFGLSDERYGIGPGLRYDLPIGALRLDYGFNPDPRPHEKMGAFQFSFGLAF